MFSRLINFLFRRHTLSYHLHYIEKLITEKQYAEASTAAYLALEKFPNSSEILNLKTQAEKQFSTYLYQKEF